MGRSIRKSGWKRKTRPGQTFSKSCHQPKQAPVKITYMEGFGPPAKPD